jgi:hypothetical protein
MEAIRDDDPKRDDLRHVMKTWEEVFHSDPYTAREVIAEATREHNGALIHPDLNESLMQVANASGRIDSRRLGKWLSRNEKCVANGQYFDRDGNDGHGMVRWALRPATDPLNAKSNPGYPGYEGLNLKLWNA